MTTYTTIANIRGPQGPAGPQGPRGISAPTSEATDAVVAALLDGTDTEAGALVHSLYLAREDWRQRMWTPQDFDPLAGTPGYNSTVAVQSAIDAAVAQNDYTDSEAPQPEPHGNGCVFLPKGTYDVDELTIAGTLQMYGNGGGIWAASVLRSRTPGQSIIRITGAPDAIGSTCTVFEGITFKQSAGSPVEVAQVVTNTGISSNSLYFRRCWFKTPEWYAIWVTQGNDIVVDSCTFDVIPLSAIRLGDGANQVTGAAISNCVFYDVGVSAVDLANASGCVISGNRMYGGSSVSSLFVRFAPDDPHPATDITITGNYTAAAFAFADLLTGSANLSITSNVVRDSQGCFLRLQGGGVLYALTVTGNGVYGNGSSAMSSGSAVSGPGCGLQVSIITANSFIAAAETALLLDLPDARVTGNILDGNAGLRFTAVHNLASPTANGY